VRTLYLDIFSGISGDMFIGALIDLGVDAKQLEHQLATLELEHYHLHISRGHKSSIEGVKFDVHLEDGHSHKHHHTAHEDQVPGHSEHHAHEDLGPHGGPFVKTSFGQAELSVFETNVPPRFRIYFTNAKGKKVLPPKANMVQVETRRPDGNRQLFKFKPHKEYLEAIDELPEPHEFQAVLRVTRGKNVERLEIQFVESHHHHAQEHDQEHSHDHGHHHPHDHTHGLDHGHGRDFATIKHLLAHSSLSDWVKQKATAVFHRIAMAEGRIHGLPPERVHFHEVGAVVSIVDIVGVCVGLELLGKPRVLAGPAIEGTGWIDCAHGRFPIPAPATLAILGNRGIALSQCEEPHELITPTGAALLAEFAESFEPMRNLVAEKIGFGLGQRDNKTRPNVLRAILGTTSTGASTHDWETDTVAVLEANLDDLNPEMLGYFSEQALKAGALDVFVTPIQMKKNRPGSLLTILCAESDQDRFSELILKETSTFGVRRSVAERRKLAREVVNVQTPYGQVDVKVGKLDGRVLHASPEFESCKKAAQKAKVPLKQVYDAAIKAQKSA
jgi:pyridinium-3,5-bisthiocarboxylic acid mononucleotide nickel chelatase